MPEAYLTQSSRTAWRVYDGEAAVLCPDDSTLNTLNAVGTLIWESADGKTAVSAMPDLTSWLFQKTVGPHIPLSVHVDLTMRCNERCIHCYRVIERRPELTTEELKALLEDVARAGTLYLTFSGGEVFLRKDLFELIEHARRLRFDVRLKSNALLITPEKAARLRALAVRQVDISIYSADPAV